MTTGTRFPAGRRLTVPELRFDKFPPGDDPWWIRWFDYDGDGGGVTGTAMIRVVLSPLPPGIDLDHPPLLDAELAARRGEQPVARLHAGWLPVISIGTIVRSGAVVGRLGSDLRRLAFGSPTHRQHLEHLTPSSDDATIIGGRQPRSAPKPEGRPRPLGAPAEDLMPGLLGKIAYPLWVEAGRLLSIRGRLPGAAHLVLPCPEVFRVMYAPHRALAIALLGGPWSAMTARRVIDPELTDASDGDGGEPAWSVATMGGIGRAYAALAGNLWINRWGRACADRVWASVSPGAGRRGVIAATLPFDWDVLEFGVACFDLPAVPGGVGARTFGYELTSIRWPDPPRGPPSRIDWVPGWRPRSTVTEGEVEKPGRPVGSTAPDRGTPLEAVQDEDPAAGPGVDVLADGPVWTNAPEVVTVQREPRPPGTRRRVIHRETRRVAAGAGGGRGDGPALVQPQARDPFGGGGSACDRFERVVAMLDVLAGAGSIVSHAEVVPPRERRAVRGTRSVWAFPDVAAVTAAGVRHWYVRDFAGTASPDGDVRRTAMVRSIITRDGLVNLVEIEPRRPTESFLSLLFEQAGSARLESVVVRLLEAASSAQGAWRNAMRSLAVSGDPGGIGRVSVCRHAAETGDASGDPRSRPLNGKIVLAAVRSLAPIDGHPALGGREARVPPT